MGNIQELQFLDLKHAFGGWNDIKRLQTGIGSGLVTKKGLSLDIKPFYAVIKPSDREYFIYARAKRGAKDCTLEIGHDQKADSDTEDLILIKRAFFEDMDFNIIQL